MSLTELLVPTYTQMLQALSAWLDKAGAQLPETEAEALLSKRLAPDMYPLATQVRFVCLQAQEAPHRLKGEPRPERLEELVNEGRNAAEMPGTLADAKARIDEALAFLGALDGDALNDGAQRQVSIETATGLTFHLTGEQYARDWALAQFYFHVMTAYAILRSAGIELGKADYVPHMFAYLAKES